MAEKQRSKYEEKYGNLPRGGQVARMAMAAQGEYVAPVDKSERLERARVAMAATIRNDTQRGAIRNSDTERYDTEHADTVRRATELERIVSELRAENAVLRSEIEALRARLPVELDDRPAAAPSPATDAPRCIQCGAVIVGGTKRAKYCGPACKSKYHRPSEGNSTSPGTNTATPDE